MSKQAKKLSNKGHTLVGVLLPPELVAALDAEAKSKDLDRSKVIRKALRNALARTA